VPGAAARGRALVERAQFLSNVLCTTRGRQPQVFWHGSAAVVKQPPRPTLKRPRLREARAGGRRQIGHISGAMGGVALFAPAAAPLDAA